MQPLSGLSLSTLFLVVSLPLAADAQPAAAPPQAASVGMPAGTSVIAAAGGTTAARAEAAGDATVPRRDIAAAARAEPSVGAATPEGARAGRRGLVAAAAAVEALHVRAPGRAVVEATGGAPAASMARNTAAAAGQDQASGGATLGALVEEMERNNPELQAARRGVDMRVARIAPAGALPDPTFSFGSMAGFTRPPFFPSSSTPDAFRQLGFSQEFPFPGKLSLRTQVAATEAEAERWQYETRRVQLVAALKDAYFEYRFVTRSLDIVLENLTLLEQLRQIAETQFSVGKGNQQDVVKAQLEISLLVERRETLRQQRDALAARLNALLYRPADAPVPADLAFSADPLPGDLAALRSLAEARYPALERDRRLIDRGQQALALARKEVLPDFAVNVTVQQAVGGMPWMYGADVMVTVPLYWQRKQRPMIAEAAAALESSRRMRENTRAMALAQVTEEYLAATTSQRLGVLYADSVLPQAKLALQSSLAGYQVGSVDFLTLITNFASVLDAEIAYQQQQTRYYQALARIEPLAGVQLVK